MKRKAKIEIVTALEDTYDTLAIGINDLRAVKCEVGQLPHALTLIGEAITEVKKTFFNKEKK